MANGPNIFQMLLVLVSTEEAKSKTTRANTHQEHKDTVTQTKNTKN